MYKQFIRFNLRDIHMSSGVWAAWAHAEQSLLDFLGRLIAALFFARSRLRSRHAKPFLSSPASCVNNSCVRK